MTVHDHRVTPTLTFTERHIPVIRKIGDMTTFRLTKTGDDAWTIDRLELWVNDIKTFSADFGSKGLVLNGDNRVYEIPYCSLFPYRDSKSCGGE